MANNWTSQINGTFIYGAEQNEDYINNTNYKSYNNPLLQGLNYRKGIRDGLFVIDEELVLYGFSGIEGVGWKNIFSIN